MAAKKNLDQENKTVSLSNVSDADIIRYLRKLNKPFAPYVKELIRKDMGKDVLDIQFKEDLKLEILDIVKEAVSEASPKKKETRLLSELKNLLSSVGEEEVEDLALNKKADLFRKEEKIEEEKVEEKPHPGFKIVETKDDDAVVIESNSKIQEKTFDDEDIGAAAELFNMKSK